MLMKTSRLLAVSLTAVVMMVAVPLKAGDLPWSRFAAAIVDADIPDASDLARKTVQEKIETLTRQCRKDGGRPSLDENLNPKREALTFVTKDTLTCFPIEVASVAATSVADLIIVQQ